MKNLLKLFTVFVLSLCYLHGYGQVGTGLENSLGLNVGNLRNGVGLKAIENGNNGKNIEGSSLLFETNYLGRLGLKNSRYSEEVSLNYDLLTGYIIVYTLDENYYLEPKYIDSILIENPITKNLVKYVKLENEGKETIMEILCEGEVQLLKEYSAKLLKPTYNLALDTGDKQYKVKKNNAFYVFYDGELNKLPKKASKIFKNNILPKKFKKNFSSKTYSLKNEETLVKVFESLNESI